MQAKLQYQFSGKVWRYAGAGGWHFISLPEPLSVEIRNLLKAEEEGWGRLPATARIGETTWFTAIWFDSKSQTYLLPVKADIRKKEKIASENPVEVVLWV